MTGKQLSLFDNWQPPPPEIPKENTLQEMKDHHISILVSALAANIISEEEIRLQLIATIKKKYPDSVAIAQTFDSPKFTREFNLAKLEKPLSLAVKSSGDKIFYADKIIGTTKILYKSPLPGELQARMATESAIERFLEYLQKLHQIIVLDESDRHVFVFIPGAENLPNFNKLWEKFLEDVAFSDYGNTKHNLPGLVQTFIAMLNSVTLAGRGFSTLDVPILTREQSNVLAAWYLAVVREVEKRQEVRQKQIENLEKELVKNNLNDKERKSKESDLKQKKEMQLKEAKKYNESFQKSFGKKLEEQNTFWQEIEDIEIKLAESNLKKTEQNKLYKQLEKFQDKILLSRESVRQKIRLFEQANANPFELVKLDKKENPDKFKKIDSIAKNFTKTATDQINSTRGDIFAQCILEMYRLLDYWELEKYRQKESLPQPLLTEKPNFSLGRSPGDDNKEFCYSCGIKLDPKTARWQVLRFMFERPSQRRQSSSGEGRPFICASCSALAFASPLKVTDESIMLKLENIEKDDNRKPSEISRQKVKDYLRMLTNKQLHLSAGKYLVLASDQTNNRDFASKKLGQVQYALAKISSIFPREVLGDFEFSLITQGSKSVGLANRHLILIKGLMEGYSQSIIIEGKEINMTLGDAVRYVEKDLPIMAEYTLAKVAKFIGSNERRELEKTRKEYYEIMNQEESSKKAKKDKSKAEKYKDIAGLTGLTYALASSLESTARKTMKREDVEREVSKLIEKVDDAVAFCYYATLGDEKKTNVQGRLYSNSDNYFIYEQANELLKNMGVSRKEEVNEETQKFITIYSDDILNAYAYLAENGYDQDKNWKELTYQLKLSLYTRFPELVRKLKSTGEK
ncbi:MAG: hypothetical protein WBA93_05545 [Microcoleaceae cyanobacterium]